MNKKTTKYTTKINKLILTTGLGGTGKSTAIENRCKEERNNGNTNLIYFTYNRETAEEHTRKLRSLVECKTIHQFIFQELQYANALPEDFTEGRKNLSNSEFRKLEETFITYFSNEKKRFMSISDGISIFVDEYQNFYSDIKKILLLIVSKNQSNLYLYGDPYQGLYNYKNEDISNSNFETIENDFQHSINEHIILTNNYRSSASIQRLINHFAVNKLGADPAYCYSCNNTEMNTKFSFHFFTNTKDEFAHVTKEVIIQHKRYQNESITILGRNNCLYGPYKEWKEKNNYDWLIVKSIHSYIGKEAATVFIIGVNNNLSFEEAKVLYTGLIRCKENLYLSTSCPYFNTGEYFGEENIQVINKQKRVSKEYKKLKEIRHNKNFTEQKFSTLSIDSLTLKVPIEKMPFFIYIKPNVYKSRYVKTKIDNLPEGIAIETRFTQKTYFFTLADVNLLRKNSYTNKQAIEFLLNYIYNFFNYQITADDIMLHKIDICKLEKISGPEFQHICEKGIKSKTQLTDTKQPFTEVTKESIHGKTLYFNLHSRKYSGLTLVAYRPFDKDSFDSEKPLSKITDIIILILVN
ncbi:AAA family ATPase [Brucepastera parasyntrophica]|uniref:AAA family ATPase n=1 Tax=Brucepastera parasyntrophica TaxID=2880008 RepID=UPI0021094EED|nr:AAA family ATPase [Brucepastera parasyntrophica]ULQ60288.1 AAA family ATPase [Brucepastera parasyntrophica]